MLKLSHNQPQTRLAVAAVALTILLLPPIGQAQESIRPSLTSATSAQARAPRMRPAKYNFNVGPVLFDLRTDFGIEFNDNVTLSDSNRKADVVLRPSISLNSFWQVTQLNALQLDITVGYAKYLNGHVRDANTLLIAPGSQLSFDIFAGDFRINFHDQFSITQNPVDEITLSNTSDFTLFENTAGVSVFWDLNDVKLVFGYDHYNAKAITGDFTFVDRSEEQFTFSAGFQLSDATTVGLDIGGAIIDYEEEFNNDAVTLSIGPFYETQISNFLKLRASVGYQTTKFDSGGVNEDASDSSNPYAVLTLTHRVNQFITQTLSAGYQSQLGLTSNALDIAFARWGATWQMNRQIALNFDAFFEDAQESGGSLAEKAQRYGAGVGFGYQLTDKMSVGFRYQFTVKDSNLAERAYTQNVVSLNFGYDF